MGILDDMWVAHNPFNWGSLNGVNRDSAAYLRQQIDSLRDNQNISIATLHPSTVGLMLASELG